MRRTRITVTIAVLALVVDACGATVPSADPPSAPPATAPTTGPSVASTPAPSATPTPTPAPTAATTASPTDDAPTEPPEPDPAAFLQVCRAFPGPRATPPIDCEDAVRTALETLAVTTPARVEVRFACGTAPGCVRPDPDRAFVTVVVDDVATEVPLTRSADGGITAGAPRAGRVPAARAFTAPAPGRATLPGAPAVVAARSAYPLCGTEDTPMGGPYDETARTCFLAGVLAGSPVEFASIGAGTEGQPVVHLYRHDGAGGIEFVTGDGGAWRRSFTGVGEAGGGLVFDVAGMSTPPESIP